jgi:hypothetical protein
MAYVPRSRLLPAALVAAALAAVLGGIVAWALLRSDPSVSSVATVKGASDRFPSESLGDWVSYADRVSVVSVLREDAIPPVRDGYLARAVILGVEETIWKRPDAPATAASIRVITYGWAVDEGSRRPAAAWGGPRLELDGRYLVALVCAPRDGALWTPLAEEATLPLDGETVTTSGIVGAPSAVARELAGMSVDEVAEVLAQTRPNSSAATYSARCR